MASRCCSSVVKPRLLGQLILATDATQAARNSAAALGSCCETEPFVDLEAAQECRNKANRQPATNGNKRFNMVKYRIKQQISDFGISGFRDLNLKISKSQNQKSILRQYLYLYVL